MLQVSDPHFGVERPEVVEALVRLARQEGPDLLLLSGDITQRATRAQFAAARRFVDRLEVPQVLAIPGNHDIPLFDLLRRGLAPYARHRAAFGEALEPVVDDPRWLVLGLNTTRPWRHQDGEVSAAQVERVASRLGAAAPTQLRVVVVHQPIAVPRASEAHNLLHGHAAAIRAWAQAGADLVVGGHIHLPYVLPLHERDASLPHRLWAVQAGTAVSQRVRHDAGNSVNLIRLGNAVGGYRCCIIERWDCDGAERGFECRSRHELVCGPHEA